MSRGDKILLAIKKLEAATTEEDVIAEFKCAIKPIGGTHVLATGIPLPLTKINDLVQLCEWPHVKNGSNYSPDSSDLIIQKAIDWPAPFILREKFYHLSGLATAAGLPRENIGILVIPAITNFFFQGVVVTTIQHEGELGGNKDSKNISNFEQSALSCLVSSFFRKLKELDKLPKKRKGELTKREREVLSLSALGRNSEEIGGILNISIRTVIAHIQNASAKLDAANRTECVLQAIRYHQIGPGAGLGFYQIETEIYKIS